MALNEFSYTEVCQSSSQFLVCFHRKYRQGCLFSPHHTSLTMQDAFLLRMY